MAELIRRNVTLYPEDFRVVKEFGRAHGLDFSSALRFVIRDWARMRGYGEEESEGREGQARKELHKGG